MRRVEYVVETAQQLHVFLNDVVREDAELLGGQGKLRHAEVVVEGGLGTPADVQERESMRQAPIHDFF